MGWMNRNYLERFQGTWQPFKLFFQKLEKCKIFPWKHHNKWLTFKNLIEIILLKDTRKYQSKSPLDIVHFLQVFKNLKYFARFLDFFIGWLKIRIKSDLPKIIIKLKYI